MNRPTHDELRIALMVTRPGAAIGPNVACVLKAELLALREDLAQARALASALSKVPRGTDPDRALDDYRERDE